MFWPARSSRDSAKSEVFATGIWCETACAKIARILAISTRRDGRVVDGGGLENGRIGYDIAVIFCRFVPAPTS